MIARMMAKEKKGILLQEGQPDEISKDAEGISVAYGVCMFARIFSYQAEGVKTIMHFFLLYCFANDARRILTKGKKI